ncbi:MAG: C39 family peptidase [Peptococcaceae bacterium]|nr:C39 family peptidase [Peptococcaceae bacterium]
MMIKFFKRLILLVVLVWIAAIVYVLAVPVELNIQGRSQYPTLPNGCESVAASVAMSAQGVPITAETFAADYLPKAAAGTANPEDAYIGDPSSDSGYYCYPQALARGMNAFLSTQNTSLRAKTHKLVPLTEVLLRLHMNRPVIVWTTVDDEKPARSESVVWNVNGEEIHPYTNLHAVVIDGIDDFQVHLVDSVNGDRWLPLTTFAPLYYQMGLRAVYFTG